MVNSVQWMPEVGWGKADCNGQQGNLGMVTEIFYILTAEMITRV